MKHVFFVHSPITLLLSKEIILQKGYDKKDCVQVSTSYYIEKTPYHEDFFSSLYLVDFWKFNKITNPLSKEYRINKEISEKTKGNYTLYIAHDQFPFSKYFIFHKNCTQYFYIEEGMASYNKLLWGNFEKIQEAKYKLHEISPYFKNRLKNSKFNFNLNFIYFQTEAFKNKTEHLFNDSKKIKGAYSFSNQCFPFPINNNILQIPKDKKIFEINEQIPVLVFDNIVNSNLCKLETLLQITAEILSQNTTLYIKFHPAQKEDEINEIKNIIKKSSSRVFFLADQLILEEIFIQRKMKIFGFFSSLLFYNQLFSEGSGKSYSYINRIKKIENRVYDEKYTSTIEFLSENNVVFI